MPASPQLALSLPVCMEEGQPFLSVQGSSNQYWFTHPLSHMDIHDVSDLNS